MMQRKPLSRQPETSRSTLGSELSSAVVHAAALYRPVPPVACDDDGYLHDDNAMAENDYHARLRAYLGSTMRARYRHRDDVYAATDLAFHFEEGNRAAVVVPDLMVVFGASPHHRLSYKLWQEPKVPDFAAEVLCERTWRRDVHVKPDLYQDLGVKEFWILDVIDKLPDPVIGMRLNASSVYEPIPPSRHGTLVSDVLGVELLDNDGDFRFRDLATGEIIPDYTESEEMRKAAEANAEAARGEVEAAATRIAELETLLRQGRDP
ncbi:MAG: Uma2 family endonuclease [Gammaproteobacteria bacterium]|nr:Uma2 family endonuclease [Gammaproteobacteria bacterium]MYF28071.1 Uma2 family endonuclease [Gammaproteobacteria bacterium]MYK46921.1 Uma2 family endonuclease [Gammaproteobacteria bacterium]